MDLDTNVNILDFRNSVDQVFECKENSLNLNLNESRKSAEEILLEHLARALNLLDRSI